MASSTEEVSAPDVSIPSDSRKEREDNNADHFGTVFKDFDFLEYESESVEVSSALLRLRKRNFRDANKSPDVRRARYTFRARVRTISIGA